MGASAPFLEAPTAWLVEHLWLREIRGLEHVPAHGPFIAIANHASYLDPLILGTVLRRAARRGIHFWANRRALGHPVLRHYASVFGAIEVGGGAAALRIWQRSIGLLRQGRIVGIFPEGSRSRTGRLAAFRPGYLALARACGVPVLPVYLTDTFGILPPHRAVPMLVRTDARIGPPVRVPKTLRHQELRALNDAVFRTHFLSHEASRDL